jgi:hypothetical protein
MHFAVEKIIFFVKFLKHKKNLSEQFRVRADKGRSRDWLEAAYWPRVCMTRGHEASMDEWSPRVWSSAINSRKQAASGFSPLTVLITSKKRLTI